MVHTMNETVDFCSVAQEILRIFSACLNTVLLFENPIIKHILMVFLKKSQILECFVLFPRNSSQLCWGELACGVERCFSLVSLQRLAIGKIYKPSVLSDIKVMAPGLNISNSLIFYCNIPKHHILSLLLLCFRLQNFICKEFEFDLFFVDCCHNRIQGNLINIFDCMLFRF